MDTSQKSDDSVAEIKAGLELVRSEVANLNRKLESAFTKDEYDQPDYIGHRTYHRKKLNSENELAHSKVVLSRNIITWLIIGCITILGSTLVEVYIAPLLRVASTVK